VKYWIKRSLIGLVTLVAVGAGAMALALQIGQSKMNRVVALADYPIALRDDATSIKHGRYLYNSRGCADCHGSNGAGRVFLDDKQTGMRVAGGNISPGPGNGVSRYRTEDWERVVRHGVKPDGRPVLMMPSEDFNRLTDDDVAALVAYVRQLPPVPGGSAELNLPLPVRLAYGLGLLQDSAEKIDHTLAPEQPVPGGRNLLHGRYVAQGCKGCHGPHLSGGKIPGAPPSWPAAANLTLGVGSVMPRYADAQTFKAMLRSGRRPDGSGVSKVMPFDALSQMSDVDTDALYLYLRSLPARNVEGR